MKLFPVMALIASSTLCHAQADADGADKKGHGRPALIRTGELVEFDQLPEDRRKLIDTAITVAAESPWLPYKYGGSSPADGGFDCSGAMYFVLGEVGIQPPRTSAAQYQWLEKNDRLHKIAPTVTELDDPSLDDLQPGDLLFWSGTYQPTDGRSVNITHVAMYLGTEKNGGRAVMINATDGRSYRGTPANGYGVYDFKLPREGSKTKFVGYGTPPGIGVGKKPGPEKANGNKSEEKDEKESGP